MQGATDSIHSAIEDGKKDLEEDTNLLNMDSSAALQSVTSSRNPEPASLQFILRTQDITLDAIENPAVVESDGAEDSVLKRIGNIFKQLYIAIKGVFVQNN